MTGADQVMRKRNELIYKPCYVCLACPALSCLCAARGMSGLYGSSSLCYEKKYSTGQSKHCVSATKAPREGDPRLECTFNLKTTLPLILDLRYSLYPAVITHNYDIVWIPTSPLIFPADWQLNDGGPSPRGSLETQPFFNVSDPAPRS